MGNGNKDGCLQRINVTILILLAISKHKKFTKREFQPNTMVLLQQNHKLMKNK